MNLSKRKVIITGATSGIGEMVARRLNNTNYNLVVTGRNATKLAILVNQLSTSTDVIGVALDLTDSNSVKWFATEYASNASIIINSAADFGPTKPLTEVTAEEMVGVYLTNVVSPLVIAGAALRYMLSSGFGRIIDISSTSGLRGYALRVPYCTSKHAVLGMTRTINQEIHDATGGRSDIRAFCVCPGPIKGTRIETQIEERMIAKGESCKEKMERAFRLRLGRFLEPEEVVDRIMSLIDANVKDDEIITFK